MNVTRVVDQQDGWVQIDLGSVDAEDGSQDGDEKHIFQPATIT